MRMSNSNRAVGRSMSNVGFWGWPLWYSVNRKSLRIFPVRHMMSSAVTAARPASSSTPAPISHHLYLSQKLGGGLIITPSGVLVSTSPLAASTSWSTPPEGPRALGANARLYVNSLRPGGAEADAGETDTEPLVLRSLTIRRT